jgi:GTP-dependent phosphoenolpyruvate carboxykinase
MLVSPEMYSVFRRGNMKDGNYLKEQGTDGTTVLKWIFKKYTGSVGLRSRDSR